MCVYLRIPIRIPTPIPVPIPPLPVHIPPVPIPPVPPPPVPISIPMYIPIPIPIPIPIRFNICLECNNYVNEFVQVKVSRRTDLLNIETKYRPANRKPIFITTSMNSLTRVLDSMSPLTTPADERFEKE